MNLTKVAPQSSRSSPRDSVNTKTHPAERDLLILYAVDNLFFLILDLCYHINIKSFNLIKFIFMKKIILSAKPIILILAIFILSFAGAIGLRIAIAAWTGPSAPPPGSNVDAPINIGTDLQYKTGELEFRGGLSVKSSGGVDAILTTDGSGLSIDPTSDGDVNLYVTESQVSIRGAIYDHGVGDTTVNIGENLAVNGDIETTGINVAANTRSSHFNVDGTFYRYSGQVYITVDDNLYLRDTDGSTKIHFDTNQGKLTIDLIDPLYNINGEKFATYMAAMTGVKEETTGNINLECQKDSCFRVIDFDEQEKGSDLWLFYQVTDFGNDWENLVALLTPEGKNNIWYEINSSEHQLLIYGEKEGRVSYRLTAPRFDHQKWSNVSTEEGLEGMQVEFKN